ncbi:restriction endonuclease [Microcystis aeruginosa]|uniref:Restriction endonuclease n=1 Tax=Microcystis aeruginosa 11-30S32 TaxID=2358142 RepID=A0A510PLL8_MICAE|nr:restriction endonuclease [Microcystis aeruginosa]GCA94490.1 restriction endonuclease [Microcystis aeruginosa 11-30S32]
MPPDQIENLLNGILRQYQSSFSDKIYGEENDDYDPLMRVFGITPSLKRENRQYWGRELGMCWQRLVTEVFQANCSNYQPALRIEDDEPCDCILGRDAIDTKYRIGSGDSGTLKKFKQYGKLLQERKLRPILLIVREDNLLASIKACRVGGWKVLQGEESFDYILEHSGFDLLKTFDKFSETQEFYIAR